MRYEIRSVGLFSAFKVLFVLNLVLGFVTGIIYAIFFAFIFAVGAGAPFAAGGMGLPTDVPVAAMFFILPIVFALGGAVFGTIFGLIAVLLYNLIAKLIGGFELNLRRTDVEEKQPAHPAAASAQQPMPRRASAMPPPPPPPAGGSEEEGPPETSAPSEMDLERESKLPPRPMRPVDTPQATSGLHPENLPPEEGDKATGEDEQAPKREADERPAGEQESPPTGEDAERESKLPPKPSHPIDTPQSTAGIPPRDLPPEEESGEEPGGGKTEESERSKEDTNRKDNRE